MAKALTPKQLDIKIRSLKKKMTALEKKKKATSKKKTTKKKATKKKSSRKKSSKKKATKKRR